MVFLKFVNPFGSIFAGSSNNPNNRAPSPRVHRIPSGNARTALAMGDYPLMPSARTSRKTWFFLTLLFLIFTATTVLVLRLDDILMEGDGADGKSTSASSSILHRRLKTARATESLVIISEDDSDTTTTTSLDASSSSHHQGGGGMEAAGLDITHEHAVNTLLDERERAHQAMEEQKRSFGMPIVLNDNVASEATGLSVVTDSQQQDDGFEASLRRISDSMSSSHATTTTTVTSTGNAGAATAVIPNDQSGNIVPPTNTSPQQSDATTTTTNEEDLTLAAPPQGDDDDDELPDPPAALLMEDEGASTSSSAGSSSSSSTSSPIDATNTNQSPITTTTTTTSNLPIVTVSHSDLKKIHTCTYGRLEKTPTLAYVTWIWRFRKGSVEQYADKFWTPSESRLVKLRQAVGLVSDGTQDWSKVATTAALSGYTLCKVDLGATVVIAWQPRIRGDALFFTRHNLEDTSGSSSSQQQNQVRNLVIEVPHPMFDHTLNQGLYIFSETRARALIISSSHRCAKSSANTCTGNEGESIKSNCQGRTVFHNSDAAHAVQTTFFAIHEQLARDNPSDLFASVHATKNDEFVVSDGTSNPLASSLSDNNEQVLPPVATLAMKLASNIPEKRISLCNQMPSTMSSATAASLPANLIMVSEDLVNICGATNVQGRHLNGAKDPCKAVVDVRGSQLKASARFLHIEQPVALVKPASTKSSKPVMSKQLSEALVAASLALLETKV